MARRNTPNSSPTIPFVFLFLILSMNSNVVDLFVRVKLYFSFFPAAISKTKNKFSVGFKIKHWINNNASVMQSTGIPVDGSSKSHDEKYCWSRAWIWAKSILLDFCICIHLTRYRERVNEPCWVGVIPTHNHSYPTLPSWLYASRNRYVQQRTSTCSKAY